MHTLLYLSEERHYYGCRITSLHSQKYTVLFSVESLLALNRESKKSCYGLDYNDLPECCCNYLQYQYCLVSVETVITVLILSLMYVYEMPRVVSLLFSLQLVKFIPNFTLSHSITIKIASFVKVKISDFQTRFHNE